MSITLYSKYRRQNLRNAWKLSNMDKTMLYVYFPLRERGKLENFSGLVEPYARSTQSTEPGCH